jgi:hypothetical protein
MRKQEVLQGGKNRAFSASHSEEKEHLPRNKQ